MSCTFALRDDDDESKKGSFNHDELFQRNIRYNIDTSYEAMKEVMFRNEIPPKNMSKN